MSIPRSLLYAELLANIRQISVIAALNSPCDANTIVELSTDGQQIILCHGGHKSILNLPGKVASNTQLQKPALGSSELSWRLPLGGQPKPEDTEGSDAPWPAKELGPDAEFCCRRCGTRIVSKGRVTSWKDLPSENWAEMMDFWHCHKPSDHEHNGTNGHSNAYEDDPQTSRGYGANTKFTAQVGVGFVDLSTFLLVKSDCTNIKENTSSEVESQYQALSCTSCQNYVGRIDQVADGYRLYKWRLKSVETPTTYYEPSMASIITAQLQSIMLAQCCSRLLLLPMNWKAASRELSQDFAQMTTSPNESSLLNLWVLNTSLRYSTTTNEDDTQSTSSPHSRSSTGQSAMKVFWKSVSATAAEKLMDKDGVEEVALPEETIVDIRNSLRNSALSLPPSGRKFQDWNVGLLDRFEKQDQC